VIHLHAAVFVGWMALLFGQSVLAARGRIQAHMTLGKYGGPALGTAVVLAGSLILYQQITAAVAKDLFSWAEWPKILLGTMQAWFGLLGFAVLMGLGLRDRRRPAAHKRYMTLATIMLVPAAINRMDYLPHTIGIPILIAPLLAYDLYTEGRLHRATLVGAGLLGVKFVVAFL
jgi:membrane associated rhomboid family serine protease